MLQTPQQLLSGEETDYGLGWMLETVPLAGEPTRLAGHASRTLLGGSTSFMTFPERGIVVALMSNVRALLNLPSPRCVITGDACLHEV
jgi:CubicO group peptidase (beta-lactamase class C family)